MVGIPSIGVVSICVCTGDVVRLFFGVCWPRGEKCHREWVHVVFPIGEVKGKKMPNDNNGTKEEEIK